MRWFEAWDAIAGRIQGISHGAEVLAKVLAARSQIDTRSVIGHSILPEMREVQTELELFRTTFQGTLPEDATKALEDYLKGNWHNGLDAGELASVVPLVILKSRFEYAVRNTEAIGRSQVALAFEHLRRLIVVSPETQQHWMQAFKENEVSCEKLGAVHLLSHGIWAFKISGTRAATDLVFQEPIDPHRKTVESTARLLVLTEWKLVRDEKEIHQKAQEARSQTNQYASGLLSTVELKRTRYIVLVSKDVVDPPGDVELSGVTYRHVVLPVAPSVPSRVARRPASAG